MAAMMMYLTENRTDRQSGMSGAKQLSWKRVGAILALLCVAASLKLAANPCVRRPVAQFIYFYQQGEDLNVFERVLYGVLMTKTTEPSS